MAKVIRMDQLAEELTKSLKILEDVGEKKADFAYRWAGIRLFSTIIEASPVDTGRFRANWQITTGSPASGTLQSKNKKKGKTYVTNKFPKKPMRAGKIFLTNNLPYANTLEFGLYPNPVKKGTWVKKDKKYEIRSVGGFSILADKGMVRINALRFPRWLKKGLRLAP